jgi:signal transduction histidine kinase/CheY-like chemotaxis protein/HPt (histidine-containing phosphotransfer) domain-containing protein
VLLLALRALALLALAGNVSIALLLSKPLSAQWTYLALATAALALLAFLGAWYLGHRRMRECVAGQQLALAHEQQRIADLTAQVQQHERTQSDLVLAKRTAEAAVMAKGEFLATMSHEIRTPLNGIIPMLDLLQGSGLRPDQTDLVATAFGSARQLLRIVDDILDYSKLEASKLELETVGVNLRELLSLVIRLMEKLAESKRLRLSLNIDPALRLAVRGDPTRLRQVLSNLLSNAIKFTERGAVTLSAIRKGETRSHHLLRFEVRDTGIGIPAEAADRLFHAFTQADTSTTRLYGGTGLGLAISQRIVRLMGGTIGFESTQGKGTLFWVEVPLLKAVGDMASARVELSDAHMLVLSNEPRLQQRLKFALKNWGVNAAFADTTQDALAALRDGVGKANKTPFALLLADLASIRTTVVALHRNVRRSTDLDNLRIVYLRGNESPPDEVVEAGRVLVLPRDTSDAELRMALSAFLADEARSIVATEDALVEAPELVLSAPESATTSKLRGRVLLVEDNPVNRMVAQRLLDLMGLVCDAVENGKLAIERLVDHRYDAVLMDCQMPIMDGYGATRLWREHEEQLGASRLPIIAMTANAMAGDRQKCLEAGMDDYLPKPVTREQMRATLARWITQPAAPAIAPAVVSPPAHSAPIQPASQPVVNAPPSKPRTSEVPGAMPPLSNQFIRGPAIDREVTEELRDVMGDDFRSLVKVFLEDAPGHLAQLEAAALGADLAAMTGPAHSLKSASANLGATLLSDLARTIESGARKGQLAAPELRVARLAQELYRASDELRRFL